MISSVPGKSLIHYVVTANLPLAKIQFSHTVTNVANFLQLSVPGTTRSLIFINLVNVQYDHLFQSEERQLENITRTRLTLQYDQ